MRKCFITNGVMKKTIGDIEMGQIGQTSKCRIRQSPLFATRYIEKSQVGKTGKCSISGNQISATSHVEIFEFG
jgi:hypothetical protein